MRDTVTAPGLSGEASRCGGVVDTTRGGEGGTVGRSPEIRPAREYGPRVASGRGRPPGKSSSPKVSRQVDRFGRMSVVSNGLCKHGARRAAGGAGGPSGIPV